MNGKQHRYMTVTVDVQPQGLNLSCWFSTQDFWLDETSWYPNDYVRENDDCVWHIHSHTELTIKAIAMVTEYADKICREAIAKNAKRKIAIR